jgi:hypothetical protein
MAELMHRAGHRSPVAALRYQHATSDRDRAFTDALSELGRKATIVSIRPADQPPIRDKRTGSIPRTPARWARDGGFSRPSRTGLGSPCRAPDLPRRSNTLERTTGFEPATLTLAR